MTITRRQALSLAVVASASLFSTSNAWAQTYPTMPVRLVVGFPPGGAADIAARIIAQGLSERFGQQFIVENRPGAATNIATEVVVRAKADGHTLLLITTSNLLNGALFDKLSYDFIRDITPIASIWRTPLVLVVGSEFPAATVPEFIAYAKAHPGKINMASFGNGTIGHLATELLKGIAGIDLLHVPYNGSAPMVVDLLGGHVHAAFDTVPSALGHIQSGKLRALAITAATRLELLPDVATVGSFLSGYEVGPIAGVGAPKDTPVEVIRKLNQEINAVLADPKIGARVAAMGGIVLTNSADDYAKLIGDETQKWSKVIKSSGVKVN